MANIVEYTNGSADTITEPSSLAGIKNRFQKALAEGEFAALKDEGDDRVFVNPTEVVRVYSDGEEG